MPAAFKIRRQTGPYDPGGPELSGLEVDQALGAWPYPEVAHGLSVGDVVTLTSVNTHALAQADAPANVVGLEVVLFVIDANNLITIPWHQRCLITSTAHGLGAFGTAVYLSATVAGAISATISAVKLGRVWDADTIEWAPPDPIAAFEVPGRLLVTQAGHGLSTGEWAMFSVGSNWVQMDVTMPMVNGADGVIGAYVEAVDGNLLLLRTEGTIWVTHLETPGLLYGSTTPGVVTSTEPGLNAVRWQVALAASAEQLSITPNQWTQL